MNRRDIQVERHGHPTARVLWKTLALYLGMLAASALLTYEVERELASLALALAWT